MSSKAVNRAYLALGSNIQPEENLPAAVQALTQFGQIKQVSSVWESKPVGDVNQANFLNAAVLLLTSLSARELRLDAINFVEQQLQRKRDAGNMNAARTIDIDIALFNQDILSIEHRKIPDPEIFERAFLAIPLAEIDPGYVHPETNQTLEEITTSFGPQADAMLRRSDVRLNSDEL